MSGKSAEGISGGHYFFRVLAFAFFFGWSVAWGPATAAGLTPETQALFLAVSAGDMKAVDVEVIHQGQLVRGVGVPAVVTADWCRRFACVALVHGDDSIGARQLIDRVPRRRLPEGDGTLHATRRGQE